jgi:very-short-patch-repair endonuclease
LNLPFKVYGQDKFQVPGERQPFLLDFALPEVRVNLEANGEIWHSQPGAKERDKIRDEKLAHYGWRVIRFTEKAINQRTDEVRSVIYREVKDAVEEYNKRKKANTNNNIKKYSSTKYIVDQENGELLGVIESY